MPAIELSAGTIDYLDTGGDGPVVVPVHGVMMDATVWREVIADLRTDHRCIVPTLPLGAHRRPMRPGADLSMTGQAELLAELIERLDLDDLTLVANDWGGPLVTAVRHADLIDRLVVTPCEAFDNMPPGFPGRFAEIAGRMPGGIFLAAQALRVPALRRLPTTFGPMAASPIPGDLVAGSIRQPATSGPCGTTSRPTSAPPSATCSRPSSTTWPRSTSRPSSPGPPTGGSCPPSTGRASPSCCPTGTTRRSPAVASSSSSTSPAPSPA